MGSDKTNSRSLLIVCLSVVASVSESTLAQDSASGGMRGAMEEIVVTAQRREQSPDDIGMAISAIGGDALDQLGIADTADLSRIIPGFTFADSGLTVPLYTIRGVGYSDTSAQAQATVGVYNDQISMPYPIMTSGLQMDVARVEVLKGPQGTLYGRNSTGGAVNYIANRPTDEFEASIRAEYGSFETLDLTGVVSGAVSDKLRARLAIRTVQSGEGWQESVSRDEELGEQDKTSIRLLLDFDVSDSLGFQFAYSYWEDKSDTQAPQFFRSDPQRPDRTTILALYDASPFPRESVFGHDDIEAADWTTANSRMEQPRADMENQTVSLTINWDINDSVTLTSLTSFSEFENNSSYDYSGWAGIPLDTEANGVTARDTISPIVRDLYDQYETLGAVGFTNQSDIEAFSQEIRLSGVTESTTWIVGVYFSDDDVESDTPQLPSFNTGTNTAHLFGAGLQGVNNPTVQDGQSWAVFAHTEWTLADQLNLTVGLRYTEDEKDYAGCTADRDGDLAHFYNTLFRAPIFPVPGTCNMFDTNNIPQSGPYEDDLNEDSVSGRLALDYRLSDETLLYASYSRGFKSGSFPTITANLWESLLPVVQEQLDAYEIGVKAEFQDGALKFNGSAYYYDYEDKQLFSKVVTIFGPANKLANVPDSTVKGVEFDVSWFPTENLYISLGGNYTDTKVEDFIGYTQVGVEGDFSGSEFPFTPEFQLFALVNYDFSIADGLDGFVSFDVSYTDEFTSDYEVAEVLDSGGNGARYPDILTNWNATVGSPFDVPDVFIQPSATKVGARIGVASSDGRWTVALWGRNLTDEYSVSRSAKTSDYIVGWTEMPRTYGVSVDYKF